jgi:REP element-mobilizing transposase RayT
MKGYDYSQEGLYFITICTDDKKCLFGKIKPEFDIGVQSINKMILNDAGRIANECWLQIPLHFPDVIVHEHIVMPNHIHGILEITKSGSGSVGVQNFEPLQSDIEIGSVGVENFQPLRDQNVRNQNIDPHRQNEYQKIIPRSIGSIVRGFKIGVTKWFRMNSDIEDVWQRNYYEVVIRNEQSYDQIADYILNNPANWKNDDLFIE